MSSEVEIELEKLYAEQKRLIDELKDLRESERQNSKETTQWRLRRDEVKQKRQVLLSKARKAKDLRDEINRRVREFKQTRDQALDRSRQIKQKIALTTSGKQETSEYDLLSVVELRYRLYELEYEFQTRSHSPSRKKDQAQEQNLVDQIATLEETIEKRVAEGRLEGVEVSTPSEDAFSELDDLKARAQTSHEEMMLLVERGEKEHAKVSQMFDEVSRLQDEENDLHQEFVESLNAVEQARATIESHQKRLDELKDEIVDLRIQRSELEEISRAEVSQKQVESLLAKKRAGEKLTPEEMEFLMRHGESPF